MARRALGWAEAHSTVGRYRGLSWPDRLCIPPPTLPSHTPGPGTLPEPGHRVNCAAAAAGVVAQAEEAGRPRSWVSLRRMSAALLSKGRQIGSRFLHLRNMVVSQQVHGSAEAAASVGAYRPGEVPASVSDAHKGPSGVLEVRRPCGSSLKGHFATCCLQLAAGPRGAGPALHRRCTHDQCRASCGRVAFRQCSHHDVISWWRLPAPSLPRPDALLSPAHRRFPSGF